MVALVTFHRSNSTWRPYDRAMPDDFLAKVRARRESPTGQNVPLKRTKRGGVLTYVYPWRKWLLGDFFLIPLDGRVEKAVRVGLYQAAARYDFEIAIKPWSIDGEPGLRVTLVVIGLRQWKVKAIALGASSKAIQFSDGRFKARKRKWAATRREEPAEASAPRSSKPNPKSSPFWADHDEELPAPETSTVVPERHMTREEIIRRALGEDE